MKLCCMEDSPSPGCQPEVGWNQKAWLGEDWEGKLKEVTVSSFRAGLARVESMGCFEASSMLESPSPLFGPLFGMQCAVIEFAGTVLAGCP